MSSVLGTVLLVASLASDVYYTKQLDRLLEQYAEYGLQLPPPDATLAMYTYKPGYVDENGVEPIEVELGFTLDGETFWTRRDKPKKVESIRCVKPDPSLLRADVSADSLVLALTAHKRGWKPLALVAIRRWTGNLRQWREPEQYLALWALGHWKYQIYNEPDTPLPVIAKYLKRTLPRSGVDGPNHRAILRSVELAAQPRNSTPGSDDALIDELINLSGCKPLSFLTPYQRLSDARADPRYRVLLHRGLAVVPALMAHLDDNRITRMEWMSWHCVPCIKDVALDLLEQFHGGPFEFAEDTPGERLKVIGKWFADAQKLGEEKYIVSQILGDEEDDRGFRGGLLWLLTEKYPERLPEIFRALIDTRANQHWYADDYAKAIAQAPIPEAEARKILEYAAIHEDPLVAAAGITYLRPFNPKLAKELLLDRLANQPGHLFATIVAEGTDADEWAALALALRRGGVALRSELLRLIAETEAPNGRSHRLSLLAEYLTDDETWVEEDRSSSPFRGMEVRNAVAILLAELLDLDAKPDRDWTAAQWAELRARVKAKVQEELRR